MLITGTPPQITLAGDETLKVKQDNNTEEITVDHLAAYIGGGGGGATDHGALTGLADDDHPQYHNNARGDARYSLLGHSHTGAYDPAGTAAAAVSAHEAAVDPHPQYLTTAEAGALYAPAVHTHTTGDITGLAEVIMDRVNTLLVAGTGISLTYDDLGDSLTISATGGGGGLTYPQAMAVSSMRI